MKKGVLFISEDADKCITDKLVNLCCNIVKLGTNHYLPLPVSKHADMQIIAVENTVVLTRELYCRHEDGMKFNSNIIISFSERNHTDRYPGDVNLNALYADGRLYANIAALDPVLKRLCESKGIAAVNVKQGYAKCSSLVIGDTALISADTSMLRAFDAAGYDTLRISPDGILLDGYGCGFIGGASYYHSYNKTVYFFGDLDSHKDCGQIRDFCKKHNTKVVSCGKFPLYDYGGAVYVD